MKTYNRGTLSGGSISDASANLNQAWGLDTLGNWTNYQWDADGGANSWTVQYRDHNGVNEVDTDNQHGNPAGNAISGTGADWVDPVFDANGNMKESPADFEGFEGIRLKYVYDAWNRLVRVTNDNDVVMAEYEYDAQNRRIIKQKYSGGVPGTALHHYFNPGWQLMEVRQDTSTNAFRQYVWHAGATDRLAITYFDPNNDGTKYQTFNTHDANNNTTALILDNAGVGVVVERYDYDPYGKASFLDAAFNDKGLFASQYDHDVLFGGYHYDGESGLYHARFRAYHHRLGRWMQRDPLHYDDGPNIYQYCGGFAGNAIDPMGLKARDLNGAKREPINISKNLSGATPSPGWGIKVRTSITLNITGELTAKEKCCDDCSKNVEVSVKATAKFNVDITITLGWDQEVSFAGLTLDGWFGLQIRVNGSASFNVTGSADKCKGEPLCFTISGEIDISGTAAGGFRVSTQGWFSFSVGGEIRGTIKGGYEVSCTWCVGGAPRDCKSKPKDLELTVEAEVCWGVCYTHNFGTWKL